MNCRRCGHHYATPEPQAPGGHTMAELMEPARLVGLFARRDDLADVASVGARLAAGVVEGV